VRTVWPGYHVAPEDAESACEECHRPVRIMRDGGGVVTESDHVFLCRECLTFALLRATEPVYLAPGMERPARAMRLWDGLLDDPHGVPEEIERAVEHARHRN
jgi:hypothetical protein